MNKLVGFGSDGAADMMGKNTGLITLMQNDHPEIIGVNCLAHSWNWHLKMFLRVTNCTCS